MAEVLTNFVLYNDNPQRHYKQIAAKSDDSVTGVYTWEGDVLQPQPFVHVNPDADVLICKNEQEAMDQAERDHEQSLAQGWHDYTPTMG
jgi:hypothetical protein